MSLSHASLLGQQLGPYRLLRRIGIGGMAEIYLSELRGRGEFRKEVALKVLHPHLQEQPAVVELFEAEARLTASLDHPNIVMVFDYRSAGGRLFMACEYVRGLDLKVILEQLAARGERLDPDLALAIAVEVARALRHAHGDLSGTSRTPILHRDLGPDNVMVARSGAVKLLDFGVAKTLVGDGEIDRIARGKWAYMSPEQVRGEPLDGRSDLFGLGALLYEMLTGKRAFAGASQVETMRRVEQASLPPAPGVDPLLESLLERLLARDRQERFPSAAAAVVALRQVQMHRAGLREQPELAALVQRLQAEGPQGASPPGFAAQGRDPPPGRGLKGSAGPAPSDLTGQITLPAVESALPGSRFAHATEEPDSVEVTDPFGADKTTLPPGRDHPSARLARPALGAAPHPQETEEALCITETYEPMARRAGVAMEPEEQETIAARPSAKAEGIGGGPPGARVPLSQDPSSKGTLGLGSEEKASESAAPSSPSVPEVFFDHFLPEAALETEAGSKVSPAQRWSRRNLITLVLALLAIAIAATAIVLAVRQRWRPGVPAPRPEQAASQTDGTASRGDEASRRRVGKPDSTGRLAHRPQGRPRATPGAPARASSAAAGQPFEASRRPPRARPARRAGPGRPRPAQRPTGLPGTGQLDLITRPPGATVLVDGHVRGQTPLRLPVSPGSSVRVMISLPGHRLYKSPIWMPSRLGRRVQLILPRVRLRLRRARPGQTAIQVRCTAGRFNRVYLNGRDTGIDCPTEPLAVLPTVHAVSVYLPKRHRVVWKKVRPRPGGTTVVSWPY